MSALSGYKTYIVAGVTIVFALVGMWSGTLDQNAGIGMILGALGLGALRNGIAAK